MKYAVRIAPTAIRMLKEITDRRVREKIVERIDKLADDPREQGKPLLGPLSGFHSVRAVGQRYRIIYRVSDEDVIVFVVAAGIRAEGSKRDIYSLAKRLVRLGLVEIPAAKAEAQPRRGERPRAKRKR